MWRLRLETTNAPLPIIGPSNMPRAIAGEPDEFTVVKASEGERQIGPMRVRLARVEHGECWATRIDDALCYPAVSGACAALDDLASGAAVLLATPGLRLEIPAGVGAGRLASVTSIDRVPHCPLRSSRIHRRYE